MRKFLLVLAVLTVAVFQVTASGEKEAAGSAGDKVVLTVWEHTPLFEKSLSNVAERFMELYPEVKVEYEIKTPENYLSLLTTSIQAGEAPDLFWHHGTATTDMENLIGQNALMDLTEYLDLGDYTEMSLSKVTYNDKIYQTPAATIDTRATFYNKDMFEEEGWDIPANFSEFEALLQEIKDAGYIPISLAGRNSWNILFLFEPILAAMHPDWMQEAAEGNASIDDPRVIDAMNKMIEWGEKGYYGEHYLGVDEAGQYLTFAKEQAAMTVAGSWTIDTLTQNNPNITLGAFQMPTSDGRKPMVVTYAAGFSVYSKTEHPEEAITFAEFLVSKEAQQLWVDGLGAISGLEGVESGSRVANEVADANLELESFYNIMIMYNAEGQSPTKVWEEDNTKLLSGSLEPEEFVETLDSMMDYSGE